MGETQEQLTLDHLKSVGSISGVEAEAMYKIRHLPKRIQNLKALGHDIVSVHKRDALNQRYVRYELQVAPPIKVEPTVIDKKPEVGDRVRVVKPYLTFGVYVKGDVGIISRANDEEDIYVTFEQGEPNCYLGCSEVEVITND